MAYTFCEDTGGNPGVERPLTVGEFDGNTLESKTRIEALEGQTGKQIDRITSSGTALTVHYTDLTTDGPFPLPTPNISAAGNWTNSTPYAAGDIVTVRGSGIYLVLVAHTTPAEPAEFDPEATDGSSDENPLYVKIGESQPINYDVAFNVFGILPEDSQSDSDGTLIGIHCFIRDVTLAADLPGACAYLDTPAADTDGCQINIEKNGSVVGGISFDPADNEGVFTFADSVGFTNGDRIALRLMVADGIAADLAVTLPGERTDI